MPLLSKRVKQVKRVHMCEPEHDPFIKRVSRVDPNMTRIHLASTHDLFINRLVVSDSWVVSVIATPSKLYHLLLEVHTVKSIPYIHHYLTIKCTPLLLVYFTTCTLTDH